MREAASFIASRSGFAAAGFVPAALQFAERTVRAWRNRRSVVRLTELDDHLLADLGLTRRDVNAALSQPLFRDPSAELRRVAGESRWRSI
ncbi:MAG: DUF1127 domain-containing protein [Propylenella sp.]